MRVAFSINGEGMGHAARSSGIIQALRGEIDPVIYTPKNRRRFFQDHVPEADLRAIKKVGFVRQASQVDYAKTVAQAVRNNLSTIRKDVKRLEEQLRADDVQAVVSDYEPYGAFAGRNLDLPVISLCHQGVLLDRKNTAAADLRGHYTDYLLAAAATLLMTGPAHELLTSSFYNGDFGGVLREELREATPTRSQGVLVYTKNPGAHEQISQALRGARATYWPDATKSQEDYNHALIHADAVIAPAGHQMICECLHLDKPVLVIPEENQFEQELNAQMLALSGRGMRAHASNLEQAVDAFMRNKDDFPLRPAAAGVNYVFHDDTAHAAQTLYDRLTHASR